MKALGPTKAAAGRDASASHAPNFRQNAGGALMRLKRAVGNQGMPQLLNGAKPAAPPIVDEVLRSPGQALEAGDRQLMEQRFGRSFGGVRVHTDSLAAESARAVGALAYTVGSQVVFAAGRYAPGTREGQSLIAHELAHVIQQKSTVQPAALEIQDASHSEEHSASATADQVMRDESSDSAVVGASGGPLRLQRQETKDSPAPSSLTGNPLVDSLNATITLDAFASDSAQLTSEHLLKLQDYKKQVAGLLSHYPDSFIVLGGHTDATDSDAHNEKLGLERANAVLAELSTGPNAVPKEILSASSLGKRALKIQTPGREPRNRRVEIQFHARRLFALPPIAAPGPSLTPPAGGLGKVTPGLGPGIGPGPGPIGGFKPIPPINLPKRDWLKDSLEKDPIIRSLPKALRDGAVDALKDVDEKGAEKVIDALPLDEKAKAALQAIVKSLLQMAKGKEFEPPVPQPPQYQQPPSAAPPFQPSPGQVIIPIPGLSGKF